MNKDVGIVRVGFNPPRENIIYLRACTAKFVRENRGRKAFRNNRLDVIFGVTGPGKVGDFLKRKKEKKK